MKHRKLCRERISSDSLIPSGLVEEAREIERRSQQSAASDADLQALYIAVQDVTTFMHDVPNDDFCVAMARRIVALGALLCRKGWTEGLKAPSEARIEVENAVLRILHHGVRDGENTEGEIRLALERVIDELRPVASAMKEVFRNGDWSRRLIRHVRRNFGYESDPLIEASQAQGWTEPSQTVHNGESSNDESDKSRDFVGAFPAWAAARDIANHVEQSLARVKSFLRRYRKQHPDCFTLVDSARRNEARILYRTAEVLSALRARYIS